MDFCTLRTSGGRRKGGSEMRKFKIIIETGIAGGGAVLEVDDDATPDEIHDGA
ncbi:hypothetical protein ACLBOM_18960 [Escherichia coli]